MTMQERGSVVEVSQVFAGAPLAADASAGATTITVIDAGSFDEAGGSLQIGDDVYLYSAVDMATDVITLDPTTPLLVNVTVDDTAYVSPLSPDLRALVETAGGGDALDCRVPHALAPLLPVGIREVDQQESVTITSTGTSWVVEDVIGRPATVQGENVDVTTLEPIENISPDYTYPGDIPMTNVTGGVISAVFETPDVGSGVMRLSDIFGLQSLRSDGSARFDLPNSDDRAISIDAEIITSRFTSLDEFALRGVNNEIAKDAVVTLQRGTTQPITPPSVSISWDSFEVEDALGLSSNWYGLVSAGTDWWKALAFRPVSPTVSGGVLERFDATGAPVSSFPVTVDPLGGVTLLGGSLYVLGKRVTGQFGQIREWWVERYSTTGSKVGEWRLSTGDLTYVPAIGNDGTNLLFAVHPASGPLQIQPRDPATGVVVGAVIHTNVTAPRDSAAILFGNFDYGGPRYVWMPRQSGTAVARVFNTSGVEQTGGQFPAAESSRVAGMAWDGVNFRSLGQGGGRLFTYTTLTDVGQPLWVGNTWRRANATGPAFAQYETKLGNPRKFTMTRRAKLIVNTAPIPTGAGGPDAADSTTLYFGRGATMPTNANFFRRATPALGVTSVVFTSLDFTGGNPPAAGTFPNANPARIASDAPALLSIDGNGTITAPKKMQSGTVTIAIPSSAAAGFADVVFPVPFDAPPVVVSTTEDSFYNASARLRTATGCRLEGRQINNSNAAVSLVVNWIAMAP